MRKPALRAELERVGKVSLVAHGGEGARLDDDALGHVRAVDGRARADPWRARRRDQVLAQRLVDEGLQVWQADQGIVGDVVVAAKCPADLSLEAGVCLCCTLAICLTS